MKIEIPMDAAPDVSTKTPSPQARHLQNLQFLLDCTLQEIDGLARKVQRRTFIPHYTDRLNVLRTRENDLREKIDGCSCRISQAQCNAPEPGPTRKKQNSPS